MTKFILFFTFFYFFFNIKGNAYADEKDPIFPFTIDEQIQNHKDGEDVINSKSNLLSSDKYWNTPLTKLDYYLMQLKDKADETSKEIELIHSDGSGYLLNYFEKIERLKKYHKLFGRYEDFRVSSDVYYNESKGKIIIGFSIDNVGKAKKPMKELCKTLLEKDLRLRGMPDQSFSSPVYYRMLLNQLYRGEDQKELNKQVKKIADNMVYRVSITSTVSTSSEKDDYKMFSISCFKLSDEEKIIYRKWSYERK